MSRSSRPRALFFRWGLVIGVLACLALAPAPLALRAASADGDIEWFGVFSWEGMRSPRHPRKGQPFEVEVRVFRGDITGGSARIWDGAARSYPLQWKRSEGELDVWGARIAGSAADFLYYRFELRDGADQDTYNALGMWDGEPPRGDFLVDLTELGGYPLGATPVAGGTVFRLWAPGATRAAMAGSFNGWSSSARPMRGNQGFWSVLVPGAAAGDEYKLVLDSSLWRTDPRARRMTSSVGNSVVVDPSDYRWGDAGWVTPFFEDLVVYELHVGSFSGEGDGAGHVPGRYRDVVDHHLDHLARLGINCVELMPLGEFAGNRSWGYNPMSQYAPESAYGSPEDLKYLVDRCHQAGIAVILDVVFNHMGPSDLAGNLLEYDGSEIYFYPPGNGYRETPWGPRPDYGRVEVRDYLRDAVRYWLGEFHLDGFRLDGTAFINVNAEGWELLKDIARAADTVSPKAIVIAEHLPNDPAVTLPIAAGGAGIDAQWNDLFHDSLRAALGAAAFGDPDLGALAAGIDHLALGIGTRAVNYIESHDEAAVQGRAPVAADSSNPESEFAEGRSRVAAALVLFSAGIPMLLQGEELLESRPFGDGLGNRVRWSLAERHAGFLRFMRDAIALRRELVALRSDSAQNVFHVNDRDEVIAIHRWREGGGRDDLVAVASLSDRDLPGYRLGFPQGGRWYEVLNGDAAAYGGRNLGNGGEVIAGGPGRDGLPSSAEIVIPRRGVLLFSREARPGPGATGFRRGDCNGDDTLDLSDAIRGLGILFLGVPEGDCPAACDSNGDGGHDVSDAIYTLSHLFTGGLPPPAPYPGCGWRDPEPPLRCVRICGG